MDWTSPAPAKLNLCLTITGQRPDGYHDLVSLAAFTEFGDSLSVSDDKPAGLTITGPFAATLQNNLADNLLVKTKQAVLGAGFQPSEHHIHLDKQIPVSSGLGGGSTDVAAYLRCLAEMMALDEPEQARLFALARQIGADVPVCLRPGYQLMRGTGTDVEPVAVEAAGQVYCVLANPGVPVSTQAVFRALSSTAKMSPEPQITPAEPAGLGAIMAHGNDLTAPAVQACPEIGTLLDQMRYLAEPEQVFGPAMSGSGASCFALTGNQQAAAMLTQRLEAAGYWAVSTQLIS